MSRSSVTVQGKPRMWQSIGIENFHNSYFSCRLESPLSSFFLLLFGKSWLLHWVEITRGGLIRTFTAFFQKSSHAKLEFCSGDTSSVTITIVRVKRGVPDSLIDIANDLPSTCLRGSFNDKFPSSTDELLGVLIRILEFYRSACLRASPKRVSRSLSYEISTVAWHTLSRDLRVFVNW